MFNDDECIEEGGPAAFWGGLLILALLCGCSKAPQKIAQQDKIPQAQVQQMVSSIITITR